MSSTGSVSVDDLGVKESTNTWGSVYFSVDLFHTNALTFSLWTSLISLSCSSNKELCCAGNSLSVQGSPYAITEHTNSYAYVIAYSVSANYSSTVTPCFKSSIRSFSISSDLRN